MADEATGRVTAALRTLTRDANDSVRRTAAVALVGQRLGAVQVRV